MGFTYSDDFKKQLFLYLQKDNFFFFAEHLFYHEM